MLKHYLYILAIFWTCGLWAQTNGQANIFMDSTTFLIGDQVNMQIIVNAPIGNTITFPAIGDLLEKEKLELIDQKETELIKGDVNNTFKKIISMTAWEPGSYQVPEMTFSYKKNGEVVEIKSASLMLTAIIPQVTGDTTFIADIKTILAEEANFWDKLYSFITHPVVVAIFILLIAFLAFYGFMQYKNRAKPTVPLTPEEVALQRLEELKANNPLDNNDFKLFHTRISFILRAYTKDRFEVAALEQPVSQFIHKVEKHKLMKASLFEEFKTVLEHADLIKYAKASPLDIANQKALDFSFELVNAVAQKLQELAEAVIDTPTKNKA